MEWLLSYTQEGNYQPRILYPIKPYYIKLNQDIFKQIKAELTAQKMT